MKCREALTALTSKANLDEKFETVARAAFVPKNTNVILVFFISKETNQCVPHPKT